MPGGVMTPEFYLAVVTMHGTIMVFFFISYVLVSGFGNYLVPLQVGARDMAFPFLNMLSYWIALLSAIVMLASFFVEGRRGGGRLDGVSAAQRRGGGRARVADGPDDLAAQHGAVHRLVHDERPEHRRHGVQRARARACR